jgi:hypothetical protein
MPTGDLCPLDPARGVRKHRFRMDKELDLWVCIKCPAVRSREEARKPNEYKQEVKPKWSVLLERLRRNGPSNP